MQKLTSFYNLNKEKIGVSYQTMKKYILSDVEKYKDSMKIINNSKNKTYYITDDAKFLKSFVS